MKLTVPFHGMNGISPKVSTHIYQIYVLSRLMYGLESVILKPGQIAELASYHKRTLREIHSLPPRTAGCAIFLLAGVPPLEAILDSQLASLLYNVHKSPSDKLRQIGLHQLSCKDSKWPKSSSWFVYCAKRLAVYDLDSLDIFLGKIKPSRAKHTILSYWTRLLQEDALTKSTLKYLDASKCSLRSPHPVWSNITCSTTETRKAIQKAKMLCGVYTLQTNRAVFNQFQVDSTCPLCLSAPEDRIHLLVNCSTQEEIRCKYLPDIIHTVSEEVYSHLSEDDKVKLILDSNFVKTLNAKCDIVDLEVVSRSYTFSVHCKRTTQLLNKE